MNQDYIKKLIRILENSKIDSIQLSSFWGMRKIKLFRSSQKIVHTDKSRAAGSSSYLENTKGNTFAFDKAKEDNDIILSPQDDSTEKTHLQNSVRSSLHDIKAPLVGTLYFSPKPGEPPFIKVGDKIEPGKILCIIEAMKIFNEIESEISGTIKKILINDSNPVEYGQAIISVEIND